MTWPPDSTPKGHPMEDGPPKFPGPLYPPDAAPGKTPSKDSPLVVACKRFAAHLGAWPWDPDSWDDSYSNRFAHGDPENDDYAGMAGIQRWAKITPAYGWFGESTYNFARSVLIPQGRTHAGEPAWDATCVALAKQAYDLSYVPPKPPAPQKTQRQLALEKAISQLGIKENPPESNKVKFTDWYGEIGPWCAMFDSWAYRQAGAPSSQFRTVKEAGQNDAYDYVPYVVSDARNGRNGLSVVSAKYVLPGDIVAYNWGGPANADAYYFDHVGLFEEWQDGYVIFSAIEGNTSTSNNSNGGEVMRRSRNVNSQGTVFIRVAE